MDKALITGGSSGIGYELAKIMASHGHDLVLVARDKKLLGHAKKDIESAYPVSVTTHVADLSVAGSGEKLYDKFAKENVAIVVNNAGIGLKGDFFKDDLSRNQTMAYLNMNTLMDLTYYFGKDFVKKGHGKILNIASVAAFFPGPKQPAYYATKAFVRSFSRALAYNLRGTGVTVTTLNPGVTKTRFFETAHAASFKGGASPQSVAKLGYRAMMAGKTEVTHGFMNKITTSLFARITPYKAQPAIIDRVSDI